MSERPRIGEVLLLKERIDPLVLSQALKQQAGGRQRLVSLLISRAQLDLDLGALALAEQLGYPAALQRHFERRDPAVVDLVPAELAARWVVLPLALARTGAMVVLARDPTPILASALEHATGRPILLSVTAATQVERMVRAAYGLDAAADEPLPERPPTLSDIGSIGLDDETPLPFKRPRTVSDMYETTPSPELPRARASTSVPPVDATLLEIDRAVNAQAVERIVLEYAAKRWQAAMLLAITGDGAVGLRGAGAIDGKVDAVEILLALPSIVRIAHDARRATSATPDSVAQDDLRRALGARRPSAAPVIVTKRVVAVLCVGDPMPGTRDTLTELDRLADALAGAYERFGR